MRKVRLTIRTARAHIGALGLVLQVNREYGEFVVIDHTSGASYHAVDLYDAVETARAMAAPRVTVTKSRDDYFAFLRMFADAWTGTLCTDPCANGERYMRIVQRWSDRKVWGPSAFANLQRES